MSIADKRICSVVKESLDHADVVAHLQAHVKYAREKPRARKNHRARISTVPVLNEDNDLDSAKMVHSQKRFGLGQKDLLKARTLSRSFLLDTEASC